MKVRRSLSTVVVVVCSLAWGCGSDKESAASRVGAGASSASGSPSDGSGSNSSGTAASAGVDLVISLGGATAGTKPGNGMPEICDGIDNDGNGIIDDVDKNGDGICDCLLIATLGVKGGAGQGDVFSSWLSTRSNNGATDLADQVLTPALLAKYQVIVAQNVSKNHPYSAAEVKAMADWVNNGGGFMTLIGYTTDVSEVQNVNLLLAPFMMDYAAQQILPKVGRNTTPITMWNPHPIDAGVTAVGVDNGYPVEGKGDVIATGGGFDVGKVQVVGKGHVFMWGDEWITYNSEWTSHPEYQVQLFWLNTIKWLTVATSCQVTIPPDLR